jgi:hypothetical protein
MVCEHEYYYMNMSPPTHKSSLLRHCKRLILYVNSFPFISVNKIVYSICICVVSLMRTVRMVYFLVYQAVDLGYLHVLFRIASRSGEKKHLSDKECTTFRSWASMISVAIIPLKIAFLKGRLLRYIDIPIIIVFYKYRLLDIEIFDISEYRYFSVLSISRLRLYI